MKNFSTWILVMFMVMFWVLRIIVALAYQLKWDFPIQPIDGQIQFEIILLFVTLLCVILIVKRKMVGGLIYLLSYGLYFGINIVNNLKAMKKTSR